MIQLYFTVGISLADANTAALFQCVKPTTAAIVGAVTGQEQFTLARGGAAALAGIGVAVMFPYPVASSRAGSESGGDDSSSRRRLVGCAPLWCQGLSIAAYCLLQKKLMRETCDRREADAEAEAFLFSDAEHVIGRKTLEPDTVNQPLLLAAAGAAAGDRSVDVHAPYGPVAVTAHAYAAFFVIMLTAARVDSLGKLDSPAPFSAESISKLRMPLAVSAVALASLFASAAGYFLRAHANRHVDAAVLVLYNAAQPPIAAVPAATRPALWPSLLPAAQYSWYQAGGSLLVTLGVGISAQEKKLSDWWHVR